MRKVNWVEVKVRARRGCARCMTVALFQFVSICTLGILYMLNDANANPGANAQVLVVMQQMLRESLTKEGDVAVASAADPNQRAAVAALEYAGSAPPPI